MSLVYRFTCTSTLNEENCSNNTQLVAGKGLVPGSIPGEFSIVCIGTAFPVIPGVPSILADAVFCRIEAETI